MKERAQKVREEARQALYRTPMTEECEVPIMVATLRAILNEFQYSDDYGYTYVNADDLKALAEELEKLK
jgi:G:T/U-mismatch repair DNA glycosylase